MNPDQLFISQFKSIARALRGKRSPIKAEDAYASLAQIFDVNQSWKTACYRELLIMISEQLGHHAKGMSSWEAYTKHLQTTFNNIDAAFKNYDLLSSNWLSIEDPASLRWYLYLKNSDFKFNNRLDLLNHYLAQRHAEFKRYELSNLSMFGVEFTVPWRPKNSNKVQQFLYPDARSVPIARDKEKHFFKSVMGWLYLHDSRLLYCHFTYDNLRNAIFHNVDCRYSYFSTKEEHGDIMGADFSFCDASFSEFSYCYAREVKFYNTKLDYANFDNANLIGPLFINSSLRNAIFTNLTNNVLRNASFRNSDLQGADFTNTQLINVDFRGADLRNVKGIKSFPNDSVQYDEKTKF